MPGKTCLTGRNSLGTQGFNEAPAKCRGKQQEAAPAGRWRALASMRPQRNAGENRGDWRQMVASFGLQ